MSESDEITAGFEALMAREEETPAPAGQEQAPIEAEGQPEGEQEPVEPGQKPEEQRQPLSLEELTSRHENVKAALRESRGKQRDTERRLTEAQQTMERMEQTWARMQQQLAPPQQQQNQQPPTDQELLDQLWHERNEAIRWDQHQRQQREQQTTQARELEKRFDAVRTSMVEAEDDFRETTPDYDDAALHLNTVWDKTFELFGYDPNTRAQLLENLAFQVVEAAIAQKRDPAKAIYEAAKSMGYAKAAPQPPAQANGAERLQQLQAGQKAAKTLSGGGSGVQGEGLSLKAIASLDGAAFDAAMEKLRRAGR